MLFCKIACVVVDAYSTGKNLASIIKAQGYSCIHIKSSPTLPARYQHRDEDFILNITYEGDLEQIIELTKSYQIKCCIPGYESGVELADLLSARLQLPGNKTQFSFLKRNKYYMNEAARNANLKTVEHCQSDDLNRLVNWVRTANNYPVVAKPVDSANGDGVFFCNNDDELTMAFQSISASKNQFGIQNNMVLIEGLNTGTEYIINTVSWEKKHFVVEIWRIIRKPSSTIYDKAEFLSQDEKEWQTLADYTLKVLDALHIEYGAASTEVKYTPESGAVLLETSGRLMGNSPLAFCRDLRGVTQLSLLIEAYFNPADFLERFSRRFPPQKSGGLIVVLISDCEGNIQRNFGKTLQKLKTLHSYNIEDRIGAPLTKTIDSLTTPGELYLMGSPQDVERDYQLVRLIEATLYQKAIKPKKSGAFFQPLPVIFEQQESKPYQI